MGKAHVREAGGTGWETLERRSSDLGFTGWGLRVGERWVELRTWVPRPLFCLPVGDFSGFQTLLASSSNSYVNERERHFPLADPVLKLDTLS